MDRLHSIGVGVRIPFIRKFPVGEDKMQIIERTPELARKARAVLDSGARFMIARHSAERVEVVAARAHADAEELEFLSRREVPDGPGLVQAVDEVIREAYSKVIA